MNLSATYGSKILDVTLNAHSIKIELELSTITIDAEGDCCSHSFFDFNNDEDVIKRSLINKKLMNIDEVFGKDVAGADSKPEYEDTCRQTYFLEITTDKTVETIVMHNDSNGYYGGSFIIKVEHVVKDILE